MLKSSDNNNATSNANVSKPLEVFESELDDEIDTVNSTSEYETLNCFQHFPSSANDDELSEECSDTELITITLGEYKNLIDLIPEVEKLKSSEKRLGDELKSRDIKLKELQKAYTREQKMNLNLSNLSNVIYYMFSTFIKCIINCN